MNKVLSFINLNKGEENEKVLDTSNISFKGCNPKLN